MLSLTLIFLTSLKVVFHKVLLILFPQNFSLLPLSSLFPLSLPLLDLIILAPTPSTVTSVMLESQEQHTTTWKPNTCFFKESFIRTQPCPLIVVLSMAAFVLQWQTQVEMKTTCPTSLIIFCLAL